MPPTSRTAAPARRRNAVVAVSVAALAGASFVIIAPASASTASLNPRGHVVVAYRGNGHGHGMSQYGARGAALRGNDFRRILRFYYPGTAIRRGQVRSIRVRVAGFGTATTVTPRAGLRVSGRRGDLPVRGVRRYRLAAGPGRGLLLERLGAARGSHWRVMRFGLPSGSSFYSVARRTTRLWQSDRSSTLFWGHLIARRRHARGRAGGVYTVDRLNLDRYTAGVTPREMPASWPAPAVDAQAVAARTYGLYAVVHPRAAHYDICASTACQVYGGHARYSRSQQRLWTDDPRAATATARIVLTYGGAPAFAQFAASNGGWSVAGGEPYLVGRADPYDSAASGDPYLGAQESVALASIARWFGLRTVTGITVTRRDGHGVWGGRVLAGYLTGTTRAGHRTRLPVDGFALQYAFGLGTDWISIRRG